MVHDRESGEVEIIDVEEVRREARAERDFMMLVLAAHKDTLLKYDKLVADLNAQLATPCHNCYTLEGNMRRCARCRVASYCWRDCQVKDWPRHKHFECKRV